MNTEWCTKFEWHVKENFMRGIDDVNVAIVSTIEVNKK